MKKIISLLTAVLLTLSFASCGQNTNNDTPSDSTARSETEAVSSAPSTEASTSSDASESESGTENTDSASDSKVLVAYFSWSGNTQEMASYITQQTGGDLLEIQPETPYPTDYNECGEVALAERDNNERPAIANLPESIDEYDTILIGYPIWLAYHKLIQCTQIA